MVFSSSSSSSSSSPHYSLNSNSFSTTPVTISQEEFNNFHNIDRHLFSRLLFSLGREPAEATPVVAYLIWLEKISKDFRLVSKLLTWPDILLSDLVNEAILALNCIGSNHFPRDDDFINLVDHLPLTQNITRSSHLTLRYLLENREIVLNAVAKIINDVCDKAFIDIVQRHEHEKVVTAMTMMNNNFGNNLIGNNNMFANNAVGNVVYYNAPVQGFGVSSLSQLPMNAMEGGSSVTNAWSGLDVPSGAVYNQQEEIHAVGDNEMNEMVRMLEMTMNLSADIEDRSKDYVPVPPPDDRTIFLTFSKGYPISEVEVRDYFSRRYGDIIEAVHMQEVQVLEQPLYARLVVRPSAMNLIDAILEGIGKVKFSINGKHVWARKYVRKRAPIMTSFNSASSSSRVPPAP